MRGKNFYLLRRILKIALKGDTQFFHQCKLLGFLSKLWHISV